MNRSTRILTLIGMMFALPLAGDEMKFRNGHLADRYIVSIRLTKNQIEELKGKTWPNYPIRLTEDQRSTLRKVYKKTAPPSEIGVFKQKDLDGGCSCGLINFGILYNSNILEIPIWSLCSDKEAKEFYGPPDSPVEIHQ